jgi:hypothetical protein
MSDKDLAVKETPGSDSQSLTELRGNAGPGAIATSGSSPAARLRSVLGSQALVVILVVAVSVGSLVFMRKHGTGANQSIKAVKIEYEPPKSSIPLEEQQQILQTLAASLQPSQAAATKLEKEPFYLKVTETAAVAAPTKAAPVDNSAAIREAEIKGALANVTLNAVMDGPVPVARMNGRTVKVGDTVSELFVIAQIHDRAVDLMDEQGRTYTISMSDTGAGGNGPSPRPQSGLRANPMSQPRR